MPYVTARLLDLANARLVRARIGPRQDHLRRELAGAAPAATIASDEPLETLPSLRPEPTHGTDGDSSEWVDQRSGWTATCLQPRTAARPRRRAVVLLHGWLATRVQLRAYRHLARPLVRAGIEVWLPRLPLHVERTPPGAISGERFLSANLSASATALRQAVLELVAFRNWLRAEGRTEIAAWGISLGGWVTALSAAQARWSALCLWEPVVDPLETLARSPLAADIRAAIEDVDNPLEPLLEFVPRRRALRVPPHDTLLLLGRHDNVVFPEGARRVARAWGVGIHWLPHGHISLIASPAARRVSTAFLAARLRGRRP